MLQSILMAILTSATITGIFVVFVNTYLKNLIAHEFKQREKKLDVLVENAKIFSSSMANQQVGLYPELAELIYRVSAIMRDGLEKKSAIEWDMALRAFSSQFTELLFKYRYYFSVELFDVLHDFKHALQDSAMIIDYLTAEDRIQDQSEYSRLLPQLTANSEAIASLQIKIEGIIRNPINLESGNLEKNNS